MSAPVASALASWKRKKRYAARPGAAGARETLLTPAGFRFSSRAPVGRRSARAPCDRAKDVPLNTAR